MEMVDNRGNNNNISPDSREGFNYNFAGDRHHHDEVIKEQDRLLPIANVGRIMKQILPPNAKISKEAKETMQECVSEFISFVTGEASDKCHKEKRKTVNGDDICWALSTLGFDDYSEPLKRYLNRFRELEGEKAQQSKANSGGEDQRNEVAEVSPTRASTTSTSNPLVKFNMINERGNSSISRRF
ncbi:nuclear transcription factor Y subunit B-4 [Rosa rugosa]|uniref:nuclear transcription factor Y subunit B-4 n=1 Tax=Rosa rugosa TaxID=74645 RepID=UPI002B40C5A9|nr:nuclear transcription factor Y subunit B-4 [Rosa rugosa]